MNIYFTNFTHVLLIETIDTQNNTITFKYTCKTICSVVLKEEKYTNYCGM